MFYCVLWGWQAQNFRGGERVTTCKNTVLFKGGVGNARRADRRNRHFVGVGHAPTSMAENVLQNDLTEALQMTQHRSQIWLF